MLPFLKRDALLPPRPIACACRLFHAVRTLLLYPAALYPADILKRAVQAFFCIRKDGKPLCTPALRRLYNFIFRPHACIDGKRSTSLRYCKPFCHCRSACARRCFMPRLTDGGSGLWLEVALGAFMKAKKLSPNQIPITLGPALSLIGACTLLYRLTPYFFSRTPPYLLAAQFLYLYGSFSYR